MSIYNGFATRAQESQYGRYSEMLVGLLAKKALYSFKGREIEEFGWMHDFLTVYEGLTKLENHKYLPPKLSEGCRELHKYIRKRMTIMKDNPKDTEIHIPRPIDISEIEVARTQPREHDIKMTLRKIKETLDWQSKEAEVMEEFEVLTDRTPVMPEFFINRANSTQRSAKKGETYEKTDSRFMSPKKAVRQDSPNIRRSAFNSANRKQTTKSTPKIRAVLWKTTI